MRILAIILVSVLHLACAEILHANQVVTPSDVLTEWNESVLQMAEAEDGFLTLKGLRTTTLAHIAIHDALATIHRKYKPYIYEGSNSDAHPVAAATQAAFAVAAAQYPDHIVALEALNVRWLATVQNGFAKSQGVEIGNAAAAAIMRQRDGDGWNTEAEYQWHPMAPGVYAEFHEHSGTPQGFIFGAGWGKAQGFALESPDQFRSPPPPAIASEAYTAAFNEVKQVGRFQSIHRTPDQTHLALWWKDFAENSHNRLARDLVAKEQLELTDSARLFALLNMSIFDAYVSVFDNKFFYNHWRPYTAIRWAENDGNSSTKPEETWTNAHRHTYAFPSYPSAHGTACAAAMTAFAAVLGDDYTFTMRTPTVDIAGPFSGKIEMKPPVRTFERFSDAAMECAISRVYLGIHFRYDSEAGYALGQRVGNKIVAELMSPVSATE